MVPAELHPRYRLEQNSYKQIITHRDYLKMIDCIVLTLYIVDNIRSLVAKFYAYYYYKVQCNSGTHKMKTK